MFVTNTLANLFDCLWETMVSHGRSKRKRPHALASIVTLIRAMVVNDKCPTGVPHHVHVPWRPLYLYIGVVISATLTRFTSTVVPRSNFRCALPRPSVRFARLVLSPRVAPPYSISLHFSIFHFPLSLTVSPCSTFFTILEVSSLEGHPEHCNRYPYSLACR